MTADVVVKSAGVICGTAELIACVRLLDPDAEIDVYIDDGELVASPPQTVARIHAKAHAILSAERTGLNLVQRMSGIATATRAYVEAVRGTGAEILDTRKTAPGLRALDKRAVACGGGRNHRMGLADAILIKDNHVAIAGGITPADRGRSRGQPGARDRGRGRRPRPARRGARAPGPTRSCSTTWIPASCARPSPAPRGRARLEASGGITLDTVRAVAETGVDAISIGALTHSVTALDVSLEVHPWQS